MSENTSVGLAALFGDSSSNVFLSDVLPLLAPDSHARIAHCAAENAETAVERAFSEFDDELPRKPSAVALFLTFPANDITIEDVQRAGNRLTELAYPGAHIVYDAHTSPEIEKPTAVIIAANFK
ncbi:MAG: hypothetical protein LBN00_12060 [Oscillospiraceae bacterium]|nr:hypothetical protein [Oscillospiraceae bacterium]